MLYVCYVWTSPGWYWHYFLHFLQVMWTPCTCRPLSHLQLLSGRVCCVLWGAESQRASGTSCPSSGKCLRDETAMLPRCLRSSLNSALPTSRYLMIHWHECSILKICRIWSASAETVVFVHVGFFHLIDWTWLRCNRAVSGNTVYKRQSIQHGCSASVGQV